jgi:hypothetical protein
MLGGKQAMYIDTSQLVTDMTRYLPGSLVAKTKQLAGQFHNDATMPTQNKSSADLQGARLWLDACRKTHPDCRPAWKPFMSFRNRNRDTAMLVIDCRTRTVRAAKKNKPYICLSYVREHTQ